MPNTHPLSRESVDGRHFERALRPIDGSKRGVEIEQAVGLEVVGRAGGETAPPRMRRRRSPRSIFGPGPPRHRVAALPIELFGPRAGVPSSVLVSGK